MPHISKNKLDNKTFLKINEQLFKAVKYLRREEEAAQFLSDLFTKTERLMFAKRLAIVVMLEAGYPFRVISEALKVSESTISAMRDRFDRGGNGYRLVFAKFKREEFWQEFFKALDSIISPKFMPSITGRGRWRKIISMR